MSCLAASLTPDLKAPAAAALPAFLYYLNGVCEDISFSLPSVTVRLLSTAFLIARGSAALTLRMQAS